MLYIKFTKDYLKEFKNNEKFPKFINIMIYFYNILTGNFFKKKVENGELIILPRVNKKTKENLKKYLMMYNYKTVCLSENLRNSDFLNFIETLEIQVLNGKWLYKYLLNEIINYIVLNKKSVISNQEISIVINKITDTDIENIINFAEKCKTVNIITENENKLKRVEEYLYNEKGIILNVTQNYSKSLIKSDIIINIDCEEEELNKYVLPRKAVIINVSKDVNILHKGFDGINVLAYKIIIPQKYVSKDLNLDSFNKEILYESFIYKKTNPKNIINQIIESNVKIEYLEGTKGNIKKEEFFRMQTNKNQIKNINTKRSVKLQ